MIYYKDSDLDTSYAIHIFYETSDAIHKLSRLLIKDPGQYNDKTITETILYVWKQ